MTIKTIMQKKKKEHYIDNVKFTKAAADYAALCKKNLEAGLPKPQISNYCGECIIVLSNKIANMNCFNQYTYKDQMISDGIEVCLKYFHKFDPEAISERTGKKTAGAHAYYTKFIYNAMVNRINIEKHQMLLKQKYIAECEDIFVEIQEHDAANFSGELKEVLRDMSGDEWQEYDKKLKIKSDALKTSQLKTIIDDKEIEDTKDIVDLFYPEHDLEFFVDESNETLVW